MVYLSQRFGYVTIVGFPNAGKSTLINALVGQTVSIVTDKPHTTRAPIIGLAVHEQTQIALVDTAGILLHPERPLEKRIVQAAWKQYGVADVILFLAALNVKSQKANLELLGWLVDRKDPRPVWVLFNKADAVPQTHCLQVAEEYQPFTDRVEFFQTVSCLKGHGLAFLKEKLANAMPEGPWAYPAEDSTTTSRNVLASELTRAWVYRLLYQELPYQMHVHTDQWKRVGQSVEIHQTLFVSKPGQKGIVLGEGGKTIREIGMRARADISKELVGNRKVNLFLHVKCSSEWMNEPWEALNL